MKMKFTLTEYIKQYTLLGDNYDYVEVKKVYECNNYDDLQNLFLTLVDFSKNRIKIEVEKEIIEEVE